MIFMTLFFTLGEGAMPFFFLIARAFLGGRGRFRGPGVGSGGDSGGSGRFGMARSLPEGILSIGLDRGAACG